MSMTAARTIDLSIAQDMLDADVAATQVLAARPGNAIGMNRKASAGMNLGLQSGPKGPM